MAGLTFEGSSTSPVSVGVGGNAGITFAPRWASNQQLLIVAVAVAVIVFLWRGK